MCLTLATQLTTESSSCTTNQQLTMNWQTAYHPNSNKSFNGTRSNTATSSTYSTPK